MLTSRYPQVKVDTSIKNNQFYEVDYNEALLIIFSEARINLNEADSYGPDDAESPWRDLGAILPRQP